MLKQLPNALTASRGLAGPVVLLLVVGFGWTDAAFYLFWFAIWTDLVDGGLARWLNATSDVGEWLDPMADKFLSGFVWFTIGVMGWAPWWLVGLMLFRDLAVTAGWFYSMRAKIDWSPHMIGRLMVSFESVALVVFLCRSDWLGVHWPSVAGVLSLITLALAAGSGAIYLIRGPIPRERAADHSRLQAQRCPDSPNAAGP